MKILIDMNLSPEWVSVLGRHGWEAVHWSDVGDPRAPDHTIMNWANTNDYTVFTHDLDFGDLLAATRAKGPSVIQVRTQDVTPQHLEPLIVRALNQYQTSLENGALIVVNEGKMRARILPIIP